MSANIQHKDAILAVMGEKVMSCVEIAAKLGWDARQVSSDLSCLWQRGDLARTKLRGRKYKYQLASVAPENWLFSGVAPSKLEVAAARFGPLTAPPVRLRSGLYDVAPVLMGDPPPGRSAWDQRQRGA